MSARANKFDRTKSMTLDAAVEAFKEAKGPNALAAANLLIVALGHWQDCMIEDETFAEHVRMVAHDLREKTGDRP